METTVSDICVFMNEYASLTYAEKWDNPGLLLGHVLHHINVVLADLPLVVGVQQPLDIDGCVVGDAAPAGGQSQQQRPGGQQRSGPFPNSHLSSPLCSLSKTCVRNLQIS